MWLEYWLTQDCAMVTYWFNPGLCGWSTDWHRTVRWLHTGSTQVCVVGVLVDTGLCDGCTVFNPGLCGWSTDWPRTVWWLYCFNTGLCGWRTGWLRTVWWLYCFNTWLCDWSTDWPWSTCTWWVYMLTPNFVLEYWLDPWMVSGSANVSWTKTVRWQYCLNPRLCAWKSGWTKDCDVVVLGGLCSCTQGCVNVVLIVSRCYCTSFPVFHEGF